jgi:Lon protease-like protein
MTQESIFQPSDLPPVLPLLPLRGVILMPRTFLPVPLFDIAQIAMVTSCIQGDKKYIGLVQPISTLFDGQVLAPLFSTGCLGRIVEFGKIEGNALAVMLTGISRFDILEELPPENGCRQARVSYEAYAGDVTENADFSIDRDRLLRSLKSYLESNDLQANWEALEGASNDQLLNALSMACPFAVGEKQALLESRNPQEQSRVMTALMEMAALDSQPQSKVCH